MQHAQQQQPATTACAVNIPRQFNGVALQVFHRALQELMNRQDVFAIADTTGVAVAWIVHLQSLYKMFISECSVNPDSRMILAHLDTAVGAIYGTYEAARTQSNHGMEGQANMFTAVLHQRTSAYIKQCIMINDPNSPAGLAPVHEDALNQTILMFERLIFYNGVILNLADQVHQFPHIITHEDINKGLDAFLMFTYSIGDISGNPVIDKSIDENAVSEDGSRITEEELRIIRGERMLTASTLRFVRVLSSVDPQDFVSLIQLTKIVLPAITSSPGVGGMTDMISGLVSSAMPTTFGGGGGGGEQR